MKSIGVYIHIPFCKRKCYYCDFVSFANKENIFKDYVEALLKEIENANLEKYKIKTVYIGGGTPSILDSEDIGKILDTIRRNLEENAEITIEVNPGTVTENKLKEYISFGINRISIGLQSSSDKLLKEIGRIHNFKEFLNTYELAKKAGFKNINVDLILGLPSQTLEAIKDTLDKVIFLNPTHISIYSLILEEGTKLEEMINNKELEMIDEDLERNMYWETKRILEENGFKHYEISNFAKPGYESKHNLDCWKQKEYIGFGVAAHSYLESTRYSNIENIEKYIENINNGKFANNIIINEKQNLESMQKEYMLIGLRKIEGVSIREYKNKFGENPIFIYKTELDKLIGQNLIEIDEDNIRLTYKGLDFANIVWEEFV